MGTGNHRAGIAPQMMQGSDKHLLSAEPVRSQRAPEVTGRDDGDVVPDTLGFHFASEGIQRIVQSGV